MEGRSGFGGRRWTGFGVRRSTGFGVRRSAFGVLVLVLRFGVLGSRFYDVCDGAVVFVDDIDHAEGAESTGVEWLAARRWIEGGAIERDDRAAVACVDEDDSEDLGTIVDGKGDTALIDVSISVPKAASATSQHAATRRAPPALKESSLQKGDLNIAHPVNSPELVDKRRIRPNAQSGHWAEVQNLAGYTRVTGGMTHEPSMIEGFVSFGQ